MTCFQQPYITLRMYGFVIKQWPWQQVLNALFIFFIFFIPDYFYHIIKWLSAFFVSLLIILSAV